MPFMRAELRCTSARSAMSLDTGLVLYRGIDRAEDAGWSKLDLHLAVEIVSKAPFYKPRSESTPSRFLNGWTIRLLPQQMQPIRHSLAAQIPLDPDLSDAVRKGPVLYCVCHQLLQCHGKGQGHAWRHLHRRTLHVDAIFPTAAVWFDGL